MTVNLLLVEDASDAIELFRQKCRREMRRGEYAIQFAISGDWVPALAENRRRAFSAWASDFLTKPFNFTELRERLKLHVAKRGNR